MNFNIRSHIATEENVQEAIRLFTVSTMDAAKSGIAQQVNLTPEMANEIKVCLVMRQSSHYLYLRASLIKNYFHHEQQAESQIKRRIGIGNHLSERRLIDDLVRMGLNDSVVSTPSAEKALP